LIEFSLLNYFCSGQNANGHGKVEGCPLFLDIGWSEVNCNPPGRKIVTTILDGCLNPVFRLFHRTLWKPNRSKSRKALSDIHLHLHHIGINPKNRAAQNPG
jgi:hypothetical protein